MRRSLLWGAQGLLALLVLAFAASAIVRRWEEVRLAAIQLDPRWWLIASSVLPVLLAYLLLIQSWRILVHSWGASLSFGTAARIWFISSLGRYVPGKVWQLGAMGLLAQRRGVAPTVAMGSALVATLITTIMGLAVVLATGAPVLEVAGMTVGGRRAAVAALAVLGAALLLAPALTPRLARLVSGWTQRPMTISMPSMRALWTAALGAVGAWLLMGVGFRTFAAGIIGPLPGATPAYVAVFVGSYLIGFLVLFVPGGIVVREAAMVASLTALGLATVPEATLLALTSRLWLTVLEVLPGTLLLVSGAARKAPDMSHDASS